MDKEAANRGTLFTVRVAFYLFTCLPSSLNTAISLLVFENEITKDPIMITVLHILSVLHFSVLFIIYTILPLSSPVRAFFMETYHFMENNMLAFINRVRNRLQSYYTAAVRKIHW